jgi:3-dehydroquinate dehydratase-1
MVVGSVATAAELAALDPAAAAEACDIVEIRLDGLAADFSAPDPAAWRKLADLPLLFTARRPDEGGAGSLGIPERTAWLAAALPGAAWIDVEAASLGEMPGIVAEARKRGVRLVVSHHDFDTLPPDETLQRVATAARGAGAAVAKIAARIESPEALARLADFTLSDCAIPVATMGMGRFAAVSRLLCAQCGSVLNYGFLGDTPTAPGQWPAARLRQLIGEAVRKEEN